MAAIKLRSQRPWFCGQLKSRVFVGSCVATLMASCSLRNLDELEKSGGEGGTDNAGGSSSKGGGFIGATAGTGNTTNPNNAGGVSTATGGTTTGPATTTAPAGGVSAGGQAATTAAGGATPVPASCPAANGLSGMKIYSYGFESGLGGWEKTSGRAGTVSTDVSTCEGNSYFTLDGILRQGGWDGPAFDFLAIATVGNSYYFSAAVRFNRSNPVTVGKRLQATVATYCRDRTEAVFSPLDPVTTGNEWARLETAMPFVYRIPADCGLVTKLVVYIETPDSEDATLSVDVDDVHIWEVPATGTGGAGGGGGVAGAAGSAGVAASAGAGGSGG